MLGVADRPVARRDLGEDGERVIADEAMRQIGNAVPVNLARSLARHLLADETPSLSNFGGGITPNPEMEVPAYEEVAESDD